MVRQCCKSFQYIILSGSKISKFNQDFIKSHNEESNEGCFQKVDVQHPEKLHELHNGLPFLPERMKIEKVEKLVKLICYSHKKFKASISSG